MRDESEWTEEKGPLGEVRTTHVDRDTGLLRDQEPPLGGRGGGRGVLEKLSPLTP